MCVWAGRVCSECCARTDHPLALAPFEPHDNKVKELSSRCLSPASDFSEAKCFQGFATLARALENVQANPNTRLLGCSYGKLEARSPGGVAAKLAEPRLQRSRQALAFRVASLCQASNGRRTHGPGEGPAWLGAHCTTSDLAGADAHEGGAGEGGSATHAESHRSCTARPWRP